MDRSIPFLPALVLALVATPAAAEDAPASWRGDARFLQAAIDSVHPKPWRSIRRATWDSAVVELEAQLPSLRVDQAIGGFSRLVAKLRDGHSRLRQVRLPSHGRPALTPLAWPGFDVQYPVEFEVFSDGLRIVSATAAHPDLPGARVVAIHGRPTADVVERLAPFNSADNSMWVLRSLPAFLRTPGYLSAAGLAADPSAPLRLTLEKAGGGRREVVLAASAPDSAARWLAADRDVRTPLPLTRRLPGPYAFTDLDDSTVFARIQAIVNDPGRETFAEFVARLFAHVDSLGAPRLVLDVRGNGGGNNYLNQPLVHALLRRPALDRTGRLFVIVDRGTFSAAVSLVTSLERETRALFVGEPTGGAPNSPGDPRDVRLPASGLVVRVSTVFWDGSDPRDPRRFVAPDLPATLSYADWHAHRDPALDAIRAWRPPRTSTPEPPPNTHWGQPAKLEATEPRIAW